MSRLDRVDIPLAVVGLPEGYKAAAWRSGDANVWSLLIMVGGMYRPSSDGANPDGLTLDEINTSDRLSLASGYLKAQGQAVTGIEYW